MGQLGGDFRRGTRGLRSSPEAPIQRRAARLPDRNLGWRWTFWLIAVAFLFGVLRIPVSILELKELLSAAAPIWYVLYQALLGLLQFAIGLAMVSGYRRAGVWGEF